MPYVMSACRACDQLILPGVDPREHGPFGDPCYGDERGPERIELFTKGEVMAAVEAIGISAATPEGPDA